MTTTYRDRLVAWWKFHTANPHVYLRMVRLCRDAREAGRKKISIELVVNVLRWIDLIDVKSKGGFKITNNHKSFYAQYIMMQNPELAGIFSTKGLKKHPTSKKS